MKVSSSSPLDFSALRPVGWTCLHQYLLKTRLADDRPFPVGHARESANTGASELDGHLRPTASR